MYEQNQVSVLKRLVALGVIFITVVVLLWWGVWFIWLRDSKKPTTPKRPATTQTVPQNSDQSAQQPPTDTNTNDQSVTVPSPEQTPTPAPPTQPTELANTGAGDVVTTILVTSIVAGATYEYMLRRRVRA